MLAGDKDKSVLSGLPGGVGVEGDSRRESCTSAHLKENSFFLQTASLMSVACGHLA
jgi:hypothetical protein